MARARNVALFQSLSLFLEEELLRSDVTLYRYPACAQTWTVTTKEIKYMHGQTKHSCRGGLLREECLHGMLVLYMYTAA